MVMVTTRNRMMVVSRWLWRCFAVGRGWKAVVDAGSKGDGETRKRREIKMRLWPRLFAGKWFPFGKSIPGKVNSWKVNSDIWQCYGKWTGKHFPVFFYVIENELENNLLINFFFFKFIKIMRNKSYKLKSWMRMKLKKNIIS